MFILIQRVRPRVTRACGHSVQVIHMSYIQARENVLKIRLTAKPIIFLECVL